MGCGSSKGDAAKKVVEKPEVVFVLGGPGSGKGTQCAKMRSEYGFFHISTGDLLREERAKGGEDAEKIEEYLKNGQLVPSEMLVKLIEKEFESNGNKGKYLLDGFPRNQENYTVWNKQIGNKANVRFLLFFECSAEVMEERLLKRAETSGRTDDNPDTIKVRLETYRNETIPIVDQFTKDKMIVKVNAEKNVEEIYQELQNCLNEKKYEKMEKPEVILIAGGPRAGKNTQAQKLADQYDYQVIRVGQLLRDEIANNEPLAACLKEDVNNRVPANSEAVVKVLRRELLCRKGKFIVIGFPRNADNLTAWNKLADEYVTVKCLLLFKVSFEAIKQRLEDEQQEQEEQGEQKKVSEEDFEEKQKKFEQDFDPAFQKIKEENKIEVEEVEADNGEEKLFKNIRKTLKAKEFVKKLEKKAKKPQVLFLAGGPGSGKKTQAEKITAKYTDVQLIRVRDLLEVEVGNKKSKQGNEIKKCMDECKPVDSEIVVKLIKEKIEVQQELVQVRKFVIIGFPKNRQNITEWQKQVRHQIKMRGLVMLEVSYEQMENRLSARGDDEQKRKNRMERYQQRMEKVYKYFDKRGKACKVTADGEIEEVFQSTVEQLKEMKFVKEE